MFFDSVWSKATAVLFLKGRLSFCDTTGKPGGPAGAASVLIAYGDEARGRLFACKLQGCFVDLHYADVRVITKRSLEAETNDLFSRRSSEADESETVLTNKALATVANQKTGKLLTTVPKPPRETAALL